MKHQKKETKTQAANQKKPKKQNIPEFWFLLSLVTREQMFSG